MIQLKKSASTLCPIIVSIVIIGCGSSYVSTIDPITVTSSGNGFHQWSLYIAGLKPDKDSPYRQMMQSSEYKEYALHINKVWNGFLLSNMQKARQWRKKHMPLRYSDTVFYPFSGPDILHPLTFYPDARDIVMFGLENIGQIPDPKEFKKYSDIWGLWGLAGALDFTLKRAFFVTKDMQKRIRRSPYTGTTTVMMFFLVRGGYEIIDVKPIWINSLGKITPSEPAIRGRTIPGVEIIFKSRGNRKLRRARFFQLNISDYSPKLSTFISYMKNYPPFTTIIKSASYLMHQDYEFSKIKKAILDMSNSILQDDSGMPLNSFDERIWKITYHGFYHNPLPVFSSYRQEDLHKKLEENSTGPLPFVYGYGYGFRDMEYHLIHASKRKPAKSNRRD